MNKSSSVILTCKNGNGRFSMLPFKSYVKSSKNEVWSYQCL